MPKKFQKTLRQKRFWKYPIFFIALGDLILWHTQLNVCAENVKSWFKSWVFPFTFQAYILHHTLNCMYVSQSKFHIWIFRTVLVLPKTASSAQTHKSMSFIGIVWSTLYVYLWLKLQCLILLTINTNWYSRLYPKTLWA